MKYYLLLLLFFAFLIVAKPVSAQDTPFPTSYCLGGCPTIQPSSNKPTMQLYKKASQKTFVNITKTHTAASQIVVSPSPSPCHNKQLT